LREELKMSIHKQIQEKFWQNEFVLGLQPEERYFYMYLITNTMTTLCGIYKFSLKLAELETGLSSEVIEKHLRTFESYGKLIISKTTKEIMIVNWFKHNFKSNKKTIVSINKELREVKDKEFLKQLFEICTQRQYPVEELFNGVMTGESNKEETKVVVQAPKETTQQKEKAVHETAQDVPKEAKETEKMIFTNFNVTPRTSTIPITSRTKKRKEKPIEENAAECIDVTFDDDEEQPIRGTTIATWGFADC
jgi:hypothetical protein